MIPSHPSQTRSPQKCRTKLKRNSRRDPNENNNTVSKKSPSNPERDNKEIRALLPELCSTAQKIYDDWDQDENGHDQEVGHGGICDLISQGFSEIFAEHGWETNEGGQEGDNHSFLFIRKTPHSSKAFGIDIPPHIYETGGGYSWRKIPHVTFQPQHFTIWTEDPNLCFLKEDPYY